MITQSRDLRTGVSYWQRRPAPRIRTEKLTHDIRTDVLVVGAGITGAVIAERLSQTHSVVVVDRRGPAKGSTVASTALVEYEIDTPITHLSEAIGAYDAARAWRRSQSALEALAARTRELGIACGAQRRDSLYLCGNLMDAAELRREADARCSAGLTTLYLSRAELMSRFGVARDAALLAYDDLAVDPRRLAIGYLRAAIARGARLFAPVDLTDLQASKSGLDAISRAGPVVSAKFVVLATGYELPPFLPSDAHRIVSTYAIATKPQPRRLWPERVFVWEAADPYLYMRTTADGSVICGGEDEEISDAEARDTLIGSKAETIAGKLEALFPRLDPTPAFAWAGAFGTTKTGLPIIDRLPAMANCWAALGFGGNGMTYSRIGADIIAAALDGTVDPDADLYTFSRPTQAAGGVP